jgi:hypothetical protein
MPLRLQPGETIAALVLGAAGVALAIFIWPLMGPSDELLRSGVRTQATVVALDPTRCWHRGHRTSTEYECFKATGEWTHQGTTYRSTLGHYQQPDQAPLGSSVAILFRPDPAAAAGQADLAMRTIASGQDEPVSERPFYIALLGLAGLLMAPLLWLPIRAWRRRRSEPG